MASACPVSVKQALIDWVGPIVHEYYGATEGAGTYVDSPTWLRKPGTVGKPEDPDHVRILDESGSALPRNQAGLVYLKDYAVAIVDEAENPRHVGRRFTVGY